jgi:hypothetical protein
VADGSRHVYTDDYDNRRRYDALAPDDTPQVLNFAFTYELPFGKGKAYARRGGWSNTVLGGWKLTQNWNFQSGVPQYIPWYWYNDLYEYLPNLVGNPAAGRASKTKAQQADQWYNPNAFCAPFGCSDVIAQAMWDGVWPSPGPNGETGAVDYNAFDPWWTYGNAGLRVPSSRIPGYWNADMSLGKDFRITESKYFTFRWDVFNALNHMNLGVPNNTWCLPPRASDGGEDYIHVFACQFGRITNIQTDPRSMQFSLRFVW